MSDRRFAELPARFSFSEEEARIRDFWEQEGIYAQSLKQREGADPFVFYEGPPTANGMPHPGHCLTRAMKDLFPRYKTMRGYYCERQAGWDTHGLPVEVEVSKSLGIHSKEEIEEYGVEPFIHRCVESVWRYTKEWETLTRRLGFWVDLESAYVTYHQSYVESVWWALKSLFDAGLLYKGHKIVWWWAQGGTALSSGEVGQGYREVADPSVFVRFPVVGEDAALLVWTTTPWTLPSNHFAAVNPGLEYSLIHCEESDEKLYVASALVEQISKKAKRKFTVLETMSGESLIGKRYVPPFDFYYRTHGETRAALKGGGEDTVGWRVIGADFVTTDSGTGLVHEAPAFGEVDYEALIAERARFEDPEAVPLLCAVAPDGRFTAEAGPYEGRWVKEADKDITRAIKDAGKLFHQEQYLHDYPFCWRADEDPLIQYPRKSWFIRTTEFKERMLSNNGEMNWLPEHIKNGRFGRFLESNVDWSLSRERYWGTPLPIWVCEETGHMEAIASYEELLAKPGLSGTEVWEKAKADNPELSDHLRVHKPYIDAVTFDSPQAPGARMRRVSEVIDCWFDSGCMPFAQFGFPHQNREKFQTAFPADFISEALDQTRGWFYSLLAISTMLFGEKGVAPEADKAGIAETWPQPFRNCIVLGLLMGEDGLKMSKSKQNYKTPDYIFDKEGADAMRWLFFSGQAPWTSIRFQERAIAEGQREFLLRLYNVYAFFVIYANIDGWRPSGGVRGALREPGEGSALNELDRWILSELNRTTRGVTQAMDAFDNFGAARLLNDFVDGLSNWYLRRSRDRFWKSGMDDDKRAAYETLYHCLVSVSMLAAPFVPFLTESFYRNLVGTRSEGELEGVAPSSVHCCDYPEVDAARIDEELSTEMALVREIVSLGRAARAGARLKVRQPLSLVEIVLADSAHEAWLGRHRDLIMDELNVKAVEFTTEAEHYVDYKVKPNFPSIGPKYGKLVKGIKAALGALDPAAARADLVDKGEVHLSVDGQDVVLTSDDLEVGLTAKEGWAAAQGRGAVVVLKTEVTEELRSEGLAREVVHIVQGIRKELDLRYEQRIELHLAGDVDLLKVAEAHAPYITGETLATTLKTGGAEGEPNKAAKVEGSDLSVWVVPQ